MKRKMARRLSLLFVALLALPLAAHAKKAAFQAAPPPPDGYSLIYIYRIKVPPELRTPKVQVDGADVLKLPNNSYSWFYVSPGSHAIRTKWGFMSDVPDLEFVANVFPNQVHYLKLQGTVKSWGIARSTVYTGIKEVGEAEALAELGKKDLTYATADVTTVHPGAMAVAAAPSPSQTMVEAFMPAPPPPAGSALVYIYRPDAPPVLRRASILVDGTEAVKLPNKAYSWFYLREGSHTLKTSWGSIYRGVDLVEIPLTVQAAGTYYLRLGGTKVPKGNYDAHTSSLDPVDEGLASKELARIKTYAPAERQNVD